MNALKELYNRLSDDQKMWGIIAAVTVVLSPVFSLYFGESVVHYLLKFAAAVFEMFLPGYIIYKLFLNNLQLTEYRVMDRFIVSLAISIITVQTLSFVAEYITVFGFNEDQDQRISTENYKGPIIAVVVIAAAIGAKYYNDIVAFVKKRMEKKP